MRQSFASYLKIARFQFSTQPENRSLKSKLRLLYKLIHPDLFTDSLAAKEANEHSFKLLQDYFDSLKHGGGIGRIAGLPYKFCFYLRDENTEAGLKKVDITLPPPTRSPLAKGELSTSSLKAFGRLLEACGISSDLSAELDSHKETNTSLREFLPAAAEAVHAAASSQGGPRHTVTALLTALRLGRGVSCSFTETLPVHHQLRSMEQLLRVLDNDLPHLDLSGFKIFLGEQGYGIDSFGALWLPVNGSAQGWASYLSRVDIEEFKSKMSLSSSIRTLEKGAAAALGVSLVTTHQHLSVEAGYREFLERCNAHTNNEAGTSQYPIALVVQPHSSSAASIDDVTGTINIPLGFDTSEVITALRELGPKGAVHAARAQVEEEELAKLKGQVERTLKLRKLMRDPALPFDYFKAACSRLLYRADDLRPYLEGLPIRISYLNVLAPDRSCINISWNFTL